MTNRPPLIGSAPPRVAGTCAAVLLGAALLATAHAAIAGEADVLGVKVRTGTTKTAFSFDVTIRSRDTGWDYYAERFEVLAPDGSVLGERILLHPHTNEQPFTRELDDVRVPASVRFVTVRAWMKRGQQTRVAGGDSVKVALPGR